MKTNQTPAHAAIICATFALFTSFAVAQNSDNPKKLPVIPTGWLDAYPTIVQTGTHPTIRWGINFPSQVNDAVTIAESGTITTTEETCIECIVIGNGVTAHFPDGSWVQVPAEVFISLNGGSYEQIFLGTNENVNPDTVVWEHNEIPRGQSVNFGGRYQMDGTSGPLYTTTDGTDNVRVMVDGQLPQFPKNVIKKEFIKPYLDADGRIDIGPMDVLVMMELTHTDSQQGQVGYDLQDIALLCTMKPKGKRNNRSGLADDTNPGQGEQMGNNDGTENPNQAPHSGGAE